MSTQTTALSQTTQTSTTAKPEAGAIPLSSDPRAEDGLVRSFDVLVKGEPLTAYTQ